MCKQQDAAGVPQIENGCHGRTNADGCTLPPPEEQDLFVAGTKLCSGTRYQALSEPCGADVVFQCIIVLLYWCDY
jgi:hypothetical protein